MQADENLRGAKGVYGGIIQFFDENSPHIPVAYYYSGRMCHLLRDYACAAANFGAVVEEAAGGNESLPVQVMKGVNDPLTDIVYIDAGFWHSTAIDEFGQIWVWGRNEKGQLGLGYVSFEPQVYAIEMP